MKAKPGRFPREESKDQKLEELTKRLYHDERARTRILASAMAAVSLGPGSGLVGLTSKSLGVLVALFALSHRGLAL